MHALLDKDWVPDNWFGMTGQDGAGFRAGLSYLVISSLAINILSLAVPVMTLQVYDRILINASFGTLNILVFSVIVVVLLEAVLRVARSYTTSWAAATLEHDINCNTFDHLLKADLLAIEKHDIGESLQRVSAIGKVREFMGGQALTVLIDLPFVVLFLGLIAYLSGTLVLAPIGILIVFSYMAWVGNSELKQALTDRDTHDERRFSYMIETLSGIHSVKSMALENAFVRRYEALQTNSTELTHRISFAAGGATILGALFSELMMVTVTASGAVLVIHGELTIGTLVASVILSGRIMLPVQRTLGVWIRFQDFSIGREKIKKIFELPVSDHVGMEDALDTGGRVALEKVSFTYDGSEMILKDVDLQVEKGVAVSISGGPCCGKTTLLHVIAGLYPPNHGAARINGIESWCGAPDELVQRVGYIATQGTIFQGTIRENLTAFDDSKEEAAIEIARHLGIDEIISKLPLGMETVLNDSSADVVPNGLKQSISIARVLANKPKILLWDNADRALDRAGYNAVFKLFGRLKGKATMVIVSDDRSFLRLASKEYVLSGGHLKEKDYSDDSKVHDVTWNRDLWS